VSTLGRGSFGTVEKVRNRDDGGMYALKTIVYQVGDRKERLQALEEARLLRNLSHPCVVRFQEAFETADRESMCIVMELCFGTLVQASKHAIKQNSHFTERRVLSWLFQMSMALDFLHEQNMLHRDIKPANVFLSSHGHAVKLGDFGLVRALEGTLDMANTRCGTPLYNCSPEICESRPYNSATDMWGLGVVVYELLQLRLPFTGKRGGKMNMIQLLNSVVKDDPDPLPSRYSRGLTRLVERHLLCKDQRRRPSAWQLLQLPFVVQHMNMFLAKPHPSVSDALLGGIRECLSRIEREILDEEGEGGEEDLEEDDVEVTWHPDDFADDFGSASGSASGRRAGGRRRTSASPRGGGGGMVRGGGGGAAAAAARVDSHLGSPMDFRAGEPMTASPDFVPASGNRRSDYSSGSRKRRSVLDELDDECGYDDDDEEEDAMGNTLRQLSQEFEDIMR
jgi:NIMA (never in mitosis gene a)-related kinase